MEEEVDMPQPVEEAAIPDPMDHELEQALFVMADGVIMMVTYGTNNRMADDPRNYVDDPADLRDVLDHLFQEGRHEGGVPPMPLADIQALQTLVVEKADTGNCPICVEPFQLGDQLLLPGCDASEQHACHPACLQGWLERHSTCPVCRQTLGLEEEEEIVGLEDDEGEEDVFEMEGERGEGGK